MPPGLPEDAIRATVLELDQAERLPCPVTDHDIGDELVDQEQLEREEIIAGEVPTIRAEEGREVRPLPEKGQDIAALSQLRLSRQKGFEIAQLRFATRDIEAQVLDRVERPAPWPTAHGTSARSDPARSRPLSRW